MSRSEPPIVVVTRRRFDSISAARTAKLVEDDLVTRRKVYRREKVRQHICNHPLLRDGSIKSFFSAVDTDESGYIELAEFECALDTMGLLQDSSDAADVLHAMDFDRDGKISFSDFEIFMKVGATGLAPALGLHLLRFMENDARIVQ
jgi:hypothetical protein